MCPLRLYFIAVKSRKAKDVGGPIEFIDQQDTKKIINPKKIAPNTPK
jgi:Holliday junction resolvase-like predicted endonuclease